MKLNANLRGLKKKMIFGTKPDSWPHARAPQVGRARLGDHLLIFNFKILIFRRHFINFKNFFFLPILPIPCTYCHGNHAVPLYTHQWQLRAPVLKGICALSWISALSRISAVPLGTKSKYSRSSRKRTLSAREKSVRNWSWPNVKIQSLYGS